MIPHFKNYFPLEVKDTILEVYDHLGRKWLDVYEHVVDSIPYCGFGTIEKRYNANYYYKQYIYKSLDDTVVDVFLEVKYSHLENHQLMLKTRYGQRNSDLENSDWTVIDLSEEMDKHFDEKVEQEEINDEEFEPGSNYYSWMDVYYFPELYDIKLPYVITKERPKLSLAEMNQNVIKSAIINHKTQQFSGQPTFRI